jgi:hypothetical protein
MPAFLVSRGLAAGATAEPAARGCSKKEQHWRFLPVEKADCADKSHRFQCANAREKR